MNGFDRSIPFADRIADRVRETGSRLVVGLDPVVERFPSTVAELPIEEALVGFCQGILEAVRDEAAAVKPQVAFFERHGWLGMRALVRVVEIAQKMGIPVIADAKRGDIGSTAEAYAEAFLGEESGTPGPFVDALTVNPYLGSDSLEPFLKRVREGGRGLFVLARTSNPGGSEIQCRPEDPLPVFRQVARAASGWGAGSKGACGYHGVGLVAGATFPEELAQIRHDAPRSWLLIPGVGAQGGDINALRTAFDGEGLGGLVNSSRGVIYATAQGSQEWTEAVAEAARRTRQAIDEGVLN